MAQQDVTAIIYDRKGNILSIGKNSYVKTHPLQARYAAKVGKPKSVFMHAEINAIIKCKDISKAYKISVFRMLRNGTYGNACPCSICQEAISHTPIKILEHT